ncbi:Methyltranfer-dom domain-containing protein [Mycena chlorophos]|uniref:Methyltranfer-dom domain-containing protein n=1 Tax=Mycena chlorophos TaxID=658473 RepID=A0A8H6TN78_MYCCL|nr:Methyltranfer-dom domain-containing protein [Mycena chlorophos]
MGRVLRKLHAHDLPTRLARSERLYRSMLVQRQKLIAKFKPSTGDIALFPPQDVPPWPPYTAWDFFPPSYNCPHEVDRLGTLGSGGQWVCGASRLTTKPDCTIYSFGSTSETSFEAAILQNTHSCQVFAYDANGASFGTQIAELAPGRAHFSPFALAKKDAHGTGAVPKRYTLESLMALNGHEYIDVLRLDLEGAEFEVLTALVKPYVGNTRKALPFGQLLIQIHLWETAFPQVLAFFETLEAAGLRPFWCEYNLLYQRQNKGTSDLAEYSFLNTRGSNVFIQNE